MIYVAFGVCEKWKERKQRILFINNARTKKRASKVHCIVENVMEENDEIAVLSFNSFYVKTELLQQMHVVRLCELETMPSIRIGSVTHPIISITLHCVLFRIKASHDARTDK